MSEIISYKKNLLVLSSPSGGGKTTVARHLMGKYPQIKFSVSATTRQPRQGEKDGKDYFFFSKDEFLIKAEKGEFVEYEEIYGNYYGTLHSEIDRAIHLNSILLFDVDVKGALSLKKAYPESTLTLFLLPPGIDELLMRLKGRKSESEEEIRKRMDRALMELEMKDEFDFSVVNDELNKTLIIVENIFKENILGIEE